MQFPLSNAIKFLLNGNFSISHFRHQQANLMMQNYEQFSG